MLIASAVLQASLIVGFPFMWCVFSHRFGCDVGDCISLLYVMCPYQCTHCIIKCCLGFSRVQRMLQVRRYMSWVSVDNNTRMRKGGEKRFSPPFRIRVLLSTETEEQKKRGRPGNEARKLGYFWVPLSSTTQQI